MHVPSTSRLTPAVHPYRDPHLALVAMNVLTKQFHATEVLSVSECESVSAPFNLQIRPTSNPKLGTEHLAGAGLYLIAHSGRVVYVGSFSGSKSALFGSNIVRHRWWAHVGTLTMRGHRVSVPHRTLRWAAEEASLSSELKKVLDGASSKDMGCVTSENRIRFANRHWTEFGSASASALLTRFTFGYARIVPDPAVAFDDLTVRARITRAERGAIEQLQPEANSGVCRDDGRRGSEIQPALAQLEALLREAAD